MSQCMVNYRVREGVGGELMSLLEMNRKSLLNGERSSIRLRVMFFGYRLWHGVCTT